MRAVGTSLRRGSNSFFFNQFMKGTNMTHSICPICNPDGTEPPWAIGQEPICCGVDRDPEPGEWDWDLGKEEDFIT